jgi:hypothetical protein
MMTVVAVVALARFLPVALMVFQRFFVRNVSCKVMF